MIVDLVTAGVCGTAGFLFLRGFWHAGGIAGMIVQRPARRPAARNRVCVLRGKCVDVCGMNGGCNPPHRSKPVRFDHDAHELALFRDTGAWWLDPNRWGVEARKHEALDNVIAALDAMDHNPLTPRSRHCEVDHEHGVWWGEGPCPVCSKPPSCPICKDGGTVGALAVHGGTVSMWDCFDCGAEFTRKGETRKSKKARLARETAARAAEEAKKTEPYCRRCDREVVRCPGGAYRCHYCVEDVTPSWRHPDSGSFQSSKQETWMRPPAVYGTWVNPVSTIRIKDTRDE